ncbi:uncharacterized protein LOC126845329 [Adelges cooleyi]|uniref:uncharacterized protein LOC126842543 n=1 Tax=Adelges cooleyi TaxID=133065 RepID=UPI0021808B31|nr:uncharacterized protein LOC126842543 [Adelges cooleyi]XP_050439935.1 uncharacterized protein LOC126845329 [Adelges cooleyi]
MMISVRVLLISSLMLSAFFGTSNCVIVVNEGDIGLYFDYDKMKPNCVKKKGDNLKFAVGTCIGVWRPGDSQYEKFEGEAQTDGKYTPEEAVRMLWKYCGGVLPPVDTTVNN